ncbi:MAG: tetratricopeptide repeat protein [Ignavibacteriales bacterium]|nr:tetratricopeptide repeat protein [Ignavibacteriales bacterium]
MKRLIIWGMLIIGAASLALMGFQCSSAEMTSAKLYEQRKEYQNAEDQLLKELSKNPKNEEAWYMLGRMRYELKKLKEAKDAFDEAEKLGLKFKKEAQLAKLKIWGDLYNRGVEEINNAKEPSDFDKAIETFTMASYVMPESLMNQQSLGFAYYRKGDYQSAIEPLTVAFEQGKSETALKILVGIYMMAADRAKSAFTEANRDAIELKKNLDLVREKIKAADVKYYIGQPTSTKQETKGKGKNAIVVKEEWMYAPYNLVIVIEGDLVSSVKYTSPFVPKIDSSKIFEARAEYTKAIDVLKKGSVMFPDDPEISENLMNAFIGSERNVEARALLDERVRKYPDSKYDQYNLGVFLLKDEKFEGAVKAFKEVLRIDPEFSSATYNLAATYVNWGVAEQARLKKEGKDDDKSYQAKYKEAIPHLEKVTIEKPNDVQILELLGQVYANLGEAEKAKAAYDKADAIRQGKN